MGYCKPLISLRTMLFILLTLGIITPVKGYCLGPFLAFMNSKKTPKICSLFAVSSSAISQVSNQLALKFGSLEPVSIYYQNFDIIGGRLWNATNLVENGATLTSKLNEIDLTDEQRRKVKEEIQNTSIIGEPEVALECAYLSSFTEKNVRSLLNASLLEGRRTKTRVTPVHYLVRGSGCGKTRSLEECRISCILGFDDWHVVTTTFNNKTPFDGMEYDYANVTLEEEAAHAQEKCRLSLSLASSLAERMLQTFYGDPELRGVRRTIHHIVANITTSQDLTCVEAVRALLHGTVRHMVMRIAEKNPEKTITKFTLMVDETMKFFEKLQITEAVRIENTVSDIRAAILDERVWINETHSVGTSLVISSLTAKISGATDSGRAIDIIDLLGKLPPEQVVDRLWRNQMINETNSTEVAHFNETFRGPLLLLASTVNSLPRLVEFVALGLRREIGILKTESGKFPFRDPPKEEMMLNDEERRYFGNVIQTVLDVVRVRYVGGAAISEKHLHALCFGNPVLYTEEAAVRILQSVFTNLLTCFNTGNGPVEIVPEAALLFLTARLSVSGKTVQSDVVRSLQRGLDDIISCLKGGVNVGELLELLLYDSLGAWLLAERMEHSDEISEFKDLTSLSRLLHVTVAKKADPDYFPSTRLNNGTRVMDAFDQSIEQWTKGLGKLREIPFGNIAFSPTTWNFCSNVENDARYPSHRNRDEFFKKFIADDDLCAHVFLSYKSCNGSNQESDSYDVGMLVTPMSGDSDAFVVFMECKSRDEKTPGISGPISEVHYNTPMAKKNRMKTVEVNGKRKVLLRPAFRQFRRMCNVTFDLTLGKNYDGKYLRALRNGRWLYVYLTTDGVEDYFVDGKQLGIDSKNESEQFEGFDPSRSFMNASSTGKVLVLGKNTTLSFFSFLSDTYKAARVLWNKMPKASADISDGHFPHPHPEDGLTPKDPKS